MKMAENAQMNWPLIKRLFFTVDRTGVFLYFNSAGEIPMDGWKTRVKGACLNRYCAMNRIIILRFQGIFE